jgi:hypothetical protein
MQACNYKCLTASKSSILTVCRAISIAACDEQRLQIAAQQLHVARSCSALVSAAQQLQQMQQA